MRGYLRRPSARATPAPAATASQGSAAAPAAGLAVTLLSVTAVGATKSTLTGPCRVVAPLRSTSSSQQ